MLAAPTVADLAAYTGRHEDTFGPYAVQALAQSTLMFGIVTQLAAYPADADQAQLAANGILQMADRLYLEQPYSQIRANPFNSETIGSYTYSKGFTELLIKGQKGELTGLFWWDLAVEELSQRSRSLVTSGSVQVHNRELCQAVDSDGNPVVLGPADLIPPFDVPFADNHELNPRPKLG